jgi:anti-sigma factor ChrR (cupin superfamily)
LNTAHNRDIVIAYETFGSPDGAPLLLRPSMVDQICALAAQAEEVHPAAQPGALITGPKPGTRRPSQPGPGSCSAPSPR